jgi:uncharacterized membrane protein YgcG
MEDRTSEQPPAAERIRASVGRAARSAKATTSRFWNQQRERARTLTAQRRQRHDRRLAADAAPRTEMRDADVRRIDHVDLRPIAKIAATYYLCVLAVVLVASVLFWLFASMIGIVGSIEGFVRDVGFSGFHFVSVQLFLGLIILGLAWVGVMTVLTVLAGAFYNLLAEQLGGITVRTSVPAEARVMPKLRELADDETMHVEDQERERALAAAFASVTRNGNGSNGNGANGNGSNGNGSNGNGSSANGHSTNGHSQNGHRASSADVVGFD